MAIIKCKMCGGDMEIAPDKTFGTCEYCGSTMTMPKVDDDQRAAAFNRGNHFRRTGEFDKALSVYERIVQEDDTDAEAHWCCALCRFGIEYVEDPATYEWLPTCHRASFDSFLEDVDYLAAVEHSDGITRRQYQKDAAKIAEVQKGILATSQNEEPFDVFICYKESDDSGERTRDSILAQEIYYQLTEQGRRVFFARITLEDKAGTEYEPYIFAALNSAKVMVAVGTTAEHFNAVWVKNEWSRFLALMRKDRKKLLLPCYRDMDPYDLPEQLSVLQSYDMAKIGFMQDLTRGISKVLDADKAEPTQVKETVVVQHEGGGNVSALLKRGNMALEDGEWEKADGFFEEALNQDAECAGAYFGKFLIEQKCQNGDVYIAKCKFTAESFEASAEDLQAEADKEANKRIADAIQKYYVPGYLTEESIKSAYQFKCRYHEFRAVVAAGMIPIGGNNKNLKRAYQYAQGETKEQLEQLRQKQHALLNQVLEPYVETNRTARENVRKSWEAAFDRADKRNADAYQNAIEQRESAYQKACAEAAETTDTFRLSCLQDEFVKFGDYKDSAAQVEACKTRIEEIRAETTKQAQAVAKKRKMIAAVIAAVVVVAVAVGLIVTQLVIPARYADKAFAEMLEKGLVERSSLVDKGLLECADTYQRYVNIESPILDFFDKPFSDKDVAENAIRYMNGLQSQIDSLKYYDTNPEMHIELWNQGASDRNCAIQFFQDSGRISLDKNLYAIFVTSLLEDKISAAIGSEVSLSLDDNQATYSCILPIKNDTSLDLLDVELQVIWNGYTIVVKTDSWSSEETWNINLALPVEYVTAETEITGIDITSYEVS